MRSAVAFSAALALLRAARPATAICYYPDGTSANDVPCTDATEESACCGIGYACFGVTSQYFLCALVDDENDEMDLSSLARGSCTDQDWRSNNCPGVCVEEGRDNMSGGNGVGQCPDSDKDYYCISEGLGEANCSTNYNLIVFALEPSILTTVGVTASTSSAPASSSTSASITTTSSTTTSSTSPTTTSAAATSTSAAASSGLSSGGKAGVGVGVSLGVVAIASLAGLFTFLRRRRARDAAAASLTGGDTPDDSSIPLAPAGYSDAAKGDPPSPYGSPSQHLLAPVSEMPASPRAPSEMPASSIAPGEMAAAHAQLRYEMP